jgi:CheY-like chemotaxis protein
MSANIRILLIEDDQDDIYLLKEAIKENGLNAEFDILMQGNKIIDWVDQNSTMPDLVILDLNLPKMHGRDVLCHIKQHWRFKTVPVMVLTTSSQLSDKEFCLQNGASKFMSKPSTSEGFKELVQTIVSLSKRVLTP